MPHASQPVVDDWMKRIDDSRLLTELSIPGTHDSLTALIQGNSMPTQAMATCQRLSLAQQLQRGIRFIDVRLRYAAQLGPALVLCHGAGMFGVDMGYEPRYAVVDVCRAFLSAHPSETIVMSVKNEDQGNDERAFADLFASIVQDPAYRGLWHTGREVPTLGSVRGKIVLLRRYEQGPLGIDASYWLKNAPFRHTNGDGVSFDVQDEFREYSLLNADNKFDKYVRKTLADAVKDPDPRKLFLNFASGTSSFGAITPKRLAQTTNLKLHRYVRQAEPGRYGIVPMDFPELFNGTSEEPAFAPAAVAGRPAPLIDDLIAGIVSTNPCDHSSANGVYELRPKLAPGSALTMRGAARDICIYEALEDLPWVFPGLPSPGSLARWRLHDTGDGHFALRPESALGLALTVANAAIADGSRLTVESLSDRPEQRWKFTRLSNGLFRIGPKHAPHSVLDVYGGHRDNGNPVKLFRYYDSGPKNNGYAQRWVLVRVA